MNLYSITKNHKSIDIFSYSLPLYRITHILFHTIYLIKCHVNVLYYQMKSNQVIYDAFQWTLALFLVWIFGLMISMERYYEGALQGNVPYSSKTTGYVTDCYCNSLFSSYFMVSQEQHSSLSIWLFMNEFFFCIVRETHEALESKVCEKFALVITKALTWMMFFCQRINKYDDTPFNRITFFLTKPRYAIGCRKSLIYIYINC